MSRRWNTRVVLLTFTLMPCLLVAETPQAHLVSIGSHRLDVLDAGRGSPAIVFEGGLGNDLDTWAHVLPAAAELSRIIVYSRSGLDRSEPGPTRRTAVSAVDELHTLLTRLDVKPPYVLIGASYGGMLVRLYTSRHPSEVAGFSSRGSTNSK